MPRKALKPCKHPGCPRLTEGAYCDEHKPLHPDRPSAAKRFTAATVVDHVIPHRGDSHLMWDESNWQALCKSCHDRKTGSEDSNPEYFY